MRKSYNMNFDWDFYDGDIEHNDIKWNKVQVPHDLRHDRNQYDQDNESLMMQGYLSSGIGWYRKEFFIGKEEEGQSISLEFDGVFRNCEVYINRNFVGRHLSGYTSFDFEVSDFIHYGEQNVVSVKVDGSVFEGWWYEAVGIYRDVRLVITDSLKFKKDGVAITYEVNKNRANVSVEIEIENLGEKSGVQEMKLEMFSPKSEKILTILKEVRVKSYKNRVVEVDFDIDEIMRWDIDETYQYELELSLGDFDSYTQKFGIREIIYSNTEGVFLNGRHVKIQGVCVHDDFAGVGGAMSEAIIRHKIYLLKQMGCNAYRCSHNPPSPYVLKACDDYGLLVMDEMRLISSATEYLEQMTDTIKRDRNHPSIFIWSIGNEEMCNQGTEMGIRIVKHILRVAKSLDMSRPYIYANNCDWREKIVFNEEHGLSMDGFGFDYHSEVTLPVLIWSNPERVKNVSAYGETYPVWGGTPMENLAAADADYVAGYFVWSGFDYRGEPIPFQWPSVISRFGLMDACGFMKDLGHQYRVKWAKEPSIHVYPHWTIEKNISQLEVDIVANTDEVELFVNGVSRGIRKNEKRKMISYFVDYKVGKERGIEAVGYNQGEKVVSMSYQTAGKPYAINLEILQDREYIANGEDNVFVKVEVLDKDKNHCPNAENLITFEVIGEGCFLGTGNGDPLAHDDEKIPKRALFNGLALAILRTTRNTGTMKLIARSKGLLDTEIEILVNQEARDICK